jgi:hypothetical protein
VCFRKRAAGELIQNYYKQLTDGCGNSNCDNPTCASCPHFTFKALDRNKLALHAVALAREKARLCHGIPKKYAKLPVQETGAGEGESSGSSMDPTAGSSGSGGAKAKQPQNQTAASASSSGSSVGNKTGNESYAYIFLYCCRC